VELGVMLSWDKNDLRCMGFSEQQIEGLTMAGAEELMLIRVRNPKS
jgi:hypothetical protein